MATSCTALTGLAAPVPTTARGTGVGEGVADATTEPVGLDVGVPGGADGVGVDEPQAATAPHTHRLPSTTANLRLTPRSARAGRASAPARSVGVSRAGVLAPAINVVDKELRSRRDDDEIRCEHIRPGGKGHLSDTPGR